MVDSKEQKTFAEMKEGSSLNFSVWDTNIFVSDEFDKLSFKFQPFDSAKVLLS